MIKHALLAILINGTLIFLLGYADLMIISMNIPTFIIAGIILGLTNTLIKPLLRALTLPIIFLTLGFFSLVVNAMVLWITSYVLTVLDFGGVVMQVSSIDKFILATLLFSVINFMVQHLFLQHRGKRH